MDDGRSAGQDIGVVARSLSGLDDFLVAVRRRSGAIAEAARSAPGVGIAHAHQAIDRDSAHIEAVGQLGIGGEVLLVRAEGLALVARRIDAGEARGIVGVVLPDEGAHLVDVAEDHGAGNAIPLRGRAADVRTDQRCRVVSGEQAERGRLVVHLGQAVAIAVVPAGAALVVAASDLQAAQQRGVAELQGQVRLRCEFLVLGTTAIVLEALHAVAGEVGHIDTIEGDRRRALAVDVRGEVHRGGCQTLRPQDALYEVVAFVRPVVLHAAIDLHLVRMPVGFEVGGVKIRVQRVVLRIYAGIDAVRIADRQRPHGAAVRLKDDIAIAARADIGHVLNVKAFHRTLLA